METGSSGTYTLAYDGKGYPDIRSKIVTGLETSETHKFTDASIKINGEMQHSQVY
jgi:hypothetical protein